LLNIKINQQKLVSMHGSYTGNKWAKFPGNTLSLSKNVAKSFRGGSFLTHTLEGLFSLCTSMLDEMIHKNTAETMAR